MTRSIMEVPVLGCHHRFNERSMMIDFIILPRAGGKTTRLAKLMAADPELVYVAPTYEQAQKVGLEVTRRYDHTVSPSRFISASKAISARALTGKKIVVDEVDGVLRVLLGAEEIVAVAATGTVSTRGAVT